jgi:RNA polymerase sigma factor (sigma-70 family)
MLAPEAAFSALETVVLIPLRHPIAATRRGRESSPTNTDGHFTIFRLLIRLPKCMEEVLSASAEAVDQNRRLSETIAVEHTRLRQFIRSRVPDVGEAEDILQEVFYELVAAYRLMKPIEQAGAWLFRVARNRITDLFRRKGRNVAGDGTLATADNDAERWENLLPSQDAGPEAVYARQLLLEELEAALDELPKEQREAFVAHEIEGRSFKELSEETGVSMNTLLSRKRYAVLQLRRRLQAIYDEFSKD